MGEVAGGGRLTLIDAVVMYSRASLGGGGVIDMVNSTLNNNTAGGDGGVYTLAGTVNVKNTTVSKNAAARGGGFGVHRLVIKGPRSVDLLPSKLYLTNATVTNNTASGAGGGIFNDYSDVYPGNTILAGNFAPQGTPNDYAVISEYLYFRSQGHNLLGGRPEPGVLTESDIIDPDPELGPLRGNGGPTLTHALLPGSPAINVGGNALASGLSTDQRGAGFPRIFGDAVDIGALEVQTLPPSAPSVTVNQADGQADPTSTSPVLFTAVFSEAVEGFSGEDVILEGAAGATTAEVSGSGATYTI